jgi:hypothetical protein
MTRKSPRRGNSRKPREQYWDRVYRQWRDTPASGIRLGTAIGTHEQVYIDPRRLSTHMHVVGATNVGKSFFLEGIIKQLIVQGHGICLLDPHGDLYHRLLRFCAYLNTVQPELNLAQRVIPFDVADTANILGFNPVARNARVMTYQVVALMESIRKCWGQASFEATPRLARWLFNTAYAVIDSKLTFLQTQHMVDPTPNPYRSAITRRITNPRIKAEWEWLSTMKPENREERTESTLNKIKPFVEHELIRPMLGQCTHTLDFPSVLAGRKILLVNLTKQNAISEDNQHLLGTLLVNELLTAAFARPLKERTPFFAFIDEFQHFVTKDMCEILDGGRKFGLHLTLAHQHLNQTKIKDPEVYYSALTNARTKVVFGGMIDEDLDIIAKELYTGELNPDEIKHELWHKVYRPVETTRTIHVDNWSDSSGSSSGQISHESLVSGQMHIPGSGGFLSMPQLMSSSEARGRGSSSTRTDTNAQARGGGSSEVPWFEFHEEQELASVTFRQLEEQLYIKKAQLKRQPTQHAAVLIPGANVQLIKTATLAEQPVSDRQLAEFKQACMEAAGCYKTPQQADIEIANLEQHLLEAGRDTITIDSDAQKSTPANAPAPASKKGLWNRQQPPE